MMLFGDSGLDIDAEVAENDKKAMGQLFLAPILWRPHVFLLLMRTPPRPTHKLAYIWKNKWLFATQDPAVDTGIVWPEP